MKVRKDGKKSYVDYQRQLALDASRKRKAKKHKNRIQKESRKINRLN